MIFHTMNCIILYGKCSYSESVTKPANLSGYQSHGIPGQGKRSRANQV